MDDVLARLRALRDEAATGVLHVRGPGWPSSDIYLMGGDVVGCSAPEDEDQLAELLIAAGANRPDVEGVRRNIDADHDLVDALVGAGLATGETVTTARTDLFRDNVVWAAGTPSPSLEFEKDDAVFPPNMQLGVDQSELMADAAAWLEVVEPVLEALSDDRMRWVAVGPAPPGVEHRRWEALLRPAPASTMLSILGPPRRHALRRLGDWIVQGLLLAEDEATSDATLEQTVLDLPDPDESDGLDAEVEGDGLTADDYERAARGDFIKSYEVLDKVDLSGVAVIGAEAAQPHPAEELIAAGEDIVLGDGSHDEGLTTADFEVFDDGPEDGDLPSIQGDDFEEIEEVEEVEEIQVEEDVSADVSLEVFDSIQHVEEDVDTGAVVDLGLDDDSWPGIFTREQISEFSDRIDIFNNIFRIIYTTFSRHIGAGEARSRFNALVGSSQRQYPELLQNITIEGDGSLASAALIRNLAECPPGDYGELLHQGLYELIFSHLFDAKDMLPPDAETGMMEQIVVFERQLHQG